MWELDYKERWALNNWCFWAVVLEKTLESPLECKEIQPVSPKGNQSWIFIGYMLKLKLQYFGHLMWRTYSFEKTLMLGKIEGDNRGWDGWMASPAWWTWVWASSGRWWWTGKPGVLQSMGSQRDTTEQMNWTEMNWTQISSILFCSSCMCVLSLVQLFVTPWTVACQAPPSMGFSRQEYWSGLPFPPPRDLPNPGT